MDVNPRDVINDFEQLLRAENDASGSSPETQAQQNASQAHFVNSQTKQRHNKFLIFALSHFFDGNSKRCCLNTRPIALFRISDLEFKAKWIRVTLRYVRLGVRYFDELQ